MNTSKLMTAVVLVLLILGTFVGVQNSRAYSPSQPIALNSSAAIFEKGQPYVLLVEEGLLRRWFACSVQDVKDNWVKCDGGIIKPPDLKPVDPFKGLWINTNSVLRVATQFPAP